MRLTLSTNDGEVMDTESITFEEFRNLSPAGALALLSGMHSWDENGPAGESVCGYHDRPMPCIECA